jgi:hypothetical protein
MLNRKSTLAALAAIAVLAGAASVHAWGTFSRTTYVTFSGPVSLPGIALGTGTYIFELMDPIGTTDVVTVRDRARSTVYYSGFTERAQRPPGLRQPISLGESGAGVAPRILAWYPEGESTGHKFLYPKEHR